MPQKNNTQKTTKNDSTTNNNIMVSFYPCMDGSGAAKRAEGGRGRRDNTNVGGLGEEGRATCTTVPSIDTTLFSSQTISPFSYSSMHN